MGCSPWGRWESDTTERLHFHCSLSSIGEGNGNPLQESQGRGSLLGCRLWGSTESDLAAAAAARCRLLLGRKAMTNLDSILKSRDVTANKSPSSQSSGFSSSHVWM